MNYFTCANLTVLFVLLTAVAYVGLPSVQAHDSEHPHEHEEPDPTPPNDPIADPDEANSPEDFWGPPEGTSPTQEPNIGQPSTTISPSGVPPECQSHYDNYEGASSGMEILVTLSVLEQCIQREVEREVRAFVAQLDCNQIRTLAGELGVWESFYLTSTVSVLAGAACQRFGPNKGLPAYVTPAACTLGTAAAVTACLLTE